MFQLARCPRCDVLQLHRGLGDVEARECRSCEEPVSSGDWSVEEEHDAFDEARDRLRRLRDRSPDRGVGGGPPIPDARLPLESGDPQVRRDLADLLRTWARGGDPVPEAQVVDALSDVGAAHLLRHLLREGLLERVDDAGETSYRVIADALPDPAPE